MAGMHRQLLLKEAQQRSRPPEQRRAGATAQDKVIHNLPCDTEHLGLPGMALEPVLSAPAPPRGVKPPEFGALDLKQVAAALTFDAAPFAAREARAQPTLAWRAVLGLGVTAEERNEWR